MSYYFKYVVISTGLEKESEGISCTLIENEDTLATEGQTGTHYQIRF